MFEKFIGSSTETSLSIGGERGGKNEI